MSAPGVRRVRHVKESIVSIHELLDGRSFEQARQDRTAWLAFERCLEILSEASRGIPEQWKSEFGADIPWRRVGDLGNALRHIYDNVDAVALWSIYQDDLAPLEAAIDAMLAAHI